MTQLLQNAVCGTALILAVAALRGALKGRLLPEARLALWAVCLFRLFTPIAPTSALSFWGLVNRGAREVSASVPAAPVLTTGPVNAPSAGDIVLAAPNGMAAAPAAPVPPTTPVETGAGIPWGMILAAVWIAVGLLLAARYARAYVRTRRAVGRAIPLGREDARYAALPKCARLREGPMDGAPLTFGVARPTVVLTPGLDGPELACVLAHEGVHARRRDNLWHYAAAAVLAVFWWDPAVWLMARLIRRDVELSCDRAAVRRLGADRRAEYARALVTLSTQAEGGAFCHGFGPKRTEERIISVMKYKKATVTGIALTLALVLTVTVGFASNPGEPKVEPNIEAGAQDAVVSTPAPTAPDDAFSDDLPTGAEDDFVCFDSTGDPDVILKEYKAMLEQRVAQGRLTQAEADELLANMETLIELAIKGEIKGLMFDRQADGDVVYAAEDGMYICIREDCGNTGVHEHDGVTYKGWRGKISMPAPSICTREDCPLQPSVHVHEADGSVTYVFNECNDGLPAMADDTGTNGQGGENGVWCGFEDCTIQGTHYHYDPQVADSAGDGDGPIACPPDAIDKDFYQKYPETGNQPEPEPEDGKPPIVSITPEEYERQIDYLKESLAQRVAEGLETQENADRVIKMAYEYLERIRSGEVTYQMWQDMIDSGEQWPAMQIG